MSGRSRRAAGSPPERCTCSTPSAAASRQTRAQLAVSSSSTRLSSASGFEQYGQPSGQRWVSSASRPSGAGIIVPLLVANNAVPCSSAAGLVPALHAFTRLNWKSNSRARVDSPAEQRRPRRVFSGCRSAQLRCRQPPNASAHLSLTRLVQDLGQNAAFTAVWRPDIQQEGDRPPKVPDFGLAVLAGLDPICAWHIRVIRPWRSVSRAIGVLAHREDNGVQDYRVSHRCKASARNRRRGDALRLHLAWHSRIDHGALLRVDHWGGPARRISSVRWIANNIVVAWIIAIRRRPRSPRHVTGSHG